MAAGPIPPERLPAHPVLTWQAWARGPGPAAPAVVDAGPRVDTVSGRAALALALRRLDVGPGTDVLLPAYHCIAMVEPVVWLGARPVFYRVREDLSADVDDLEAKAGPSTRAVVAVHYFGLPAPLQAVRALCDRVGAALIEDCAHAFFGAGEEGAVGTQGDYAIASWWKFFPVRDGGCLVSSRHPLDAGGQAGGGTGFQLRAALHAVETAGRFGALRPLPWLLKPALWCKERLARALRPRRNAGQATHVELGSSAFDPRWVDVRMAAFSRFVARRVCRARLAARRAANFRCLTSALGDLPGCAPLVPEPPAGAVPYVVPVRFDDPERVFRRLKGRGVPIVRFGEFLWPGVDRSVCAVAADCSRTVLQFPCHQDLETKEMEWIAAEIKEALSPLPVARRG